jgi:hypothetical protein
VFMMLMFGFLVLVLVGIFASLQAVVGYFCYLVWPDRYPATSLCHAVSEAYGPDILVSIKCVNE